MKVGDKTMQFSHMVINMKYNKIIALIVSVTVVLGMTACGKKVDANNVKKNAIRIGVMGSIDIVPIVIADEKEYFSEQGIELDLKTFKAAKDRDAALQAGEVDGVICDTVAVSIYQNVGINMKITGMSTGVWTFVAGKDSGVNATSDLKGKKIGISEHTMIEYLADKIVIENGIKVSEIEKIIIPAMPTRLEALVNKQIDGAVLPAPFDDTAIADGGKGIEKIENKDIMISAICFLDSYIDSNDTTINGFYRAYDRAIDDLNYYDIQEYEDIIMKAVGYPESTKGNIILPEFQRNYLPDPAKVQEVFDWSFTNGIIDKPLLAEDVIDSAGIY